MREEFYAFNEEGEEIIELTGGEIKEALEGFDEIIINAVIEKLRAKYEEVCEWEMYQAKEFDLTIEKEQALEDQKAYFDYLLTLDIHGQENNDTGL